jgi:cytoskeletal protein RodZ
MNSKTLSILGVIVALLAAWLLVSLLGTSTVVVEETAVVPSSTDQSPPPEASTAGENTEVKTSATVADTDVTTTVKVAE